MKKTFKLIVVVLLLCVLFSACTKIYDKLFPGHNAKPSSEQCRIMQIEQGPGPYSTTRTGTFYYDARHLASWVRMGPVK